MALYSTGDGEMTKLVTKDNLEEQNTDDLILYHHCNELCKKFDNTMTNLKSIGFKDKRIKYSLVSIVLSSFLTFVYRRLDEGENSSEDCFNFIDSINKKSFNDYFRHVKENINDN